MIRLTAENPSGSERQAHFWLSMDAAEQLLAVGKRIQAVGDAGGNYETPRLRAILSSADGRWLAAKGEAVHFSIPVPAGGKNDLVLKLPFVSDLDGRQATKSRALTMTRNETK